VSSRLPRVRKGGFATKRAATDWAAEHVPAGIVPRLVQRAGRGWCVDFRATRAHAAVVTNRRVTLGAYAATWLASQAPPVLKPRAYDAHAAQVARHIVPDLGDRPVAELEREELAAWLAEKMRTGRVVAEGAPPAGLSRRSVRLIYSTLRAILYRAVEQRLVVGNPIAKLGKRLRLEPSARERRQRVEQRVRGAGEVGALLTTCRHVAPDWFPLLLTYAAGGLRLGEGVALEVADVDWTANVLRVERALSYDGRHLEEPKHGVRKVDMSPALRAVLAVHVAGLKRAALKRGGMPGPLLFPTSTATMLGPRNVARKLSTLAARCGIGRRLGPHDLRHSYARMLLDAGVSPVYVRDQLGHASIQLTVDTYGEGAHGRGVTRRGELERWLADAADAGFGPVALVDALLGLARGGHTAQGGHKVVTTGVLRGGRRGAKGAQVAEKISEPCADRTRDPLLKSYPDSLLAPLPSHLSPRFSVDVARRK